MDFGNNKKVSYFYDGAGQKLTKIVQNGIGIPPLCTEYLGQFVHQYAMGSTSSLKYIITPEGRLKNKGTNAIPIWEWEYNLTDHLGNVRAVLTPHATMAGYAWVNQENSYFPFGMRMSEITSTLTDNNYLYNGKEQQTDFALNCYDYGARFYDPAIGRWHSVDPMAESGKEFSPYAYCFNNPILMNDPTGMWGESIASTFIDPQGKVIEHRDDGDPKVYSVSDPKKWRENGSKKDDAEHVGYEYPGVDYASMVGRSALYYPSTAPSIPGFLTDGPIEEDYTLESLIFSGFAAYKYLNSANALYKLIPKNIKMGSQGKHIPGHNNYIQGRSILTSDAQKLLDKVHANGIKSISKISDTKMRVDFGETIGQYVDKTTGTSVSTTKGIISIAQDGAHIIPARP